MAEFLRAQRLLGSNSARPIVHGKEIQNILQAYLTLTLPVRATYNLLFDFYFGAHKIDYQTIITHLMSNNNNSHSTTTTTTSFTTTTTSNNNNED